MRNIKITLLLLLLTFTTYSQDWKIYKSGNYTYIENLVDGQLIEGGSSTIEFRKLLSSDTAYRIFKDGVDQLNFAIDVTDMQDVNGITFTISTFEDFKEVKTGLSQDINIQDQHSPVIVAYFSLVEEETLLTNTVAINDYDIVVDDPTGLVIGEYLSIFNVAANRFYVGSAVNVVGSTITMDTPMDFAFPSGSFVTSGQRNMNVNGSVTPVIFGVRNTDEAIGATFDITRIIFKCYTTGTNDLSKFGDIAGGLTNGIVLRKVDGEFRNIFNAKTNGDLKNIMFDFDIEPAQGSAQDGFTGRLTFAGQNKIGVTVRLMPGEDLQMIIQDDLTTLILFNVLLEGHEVID